MMTNDVFSGGQTILSFLAQNKDVAGWTQAAGSLVGLFAAYLFGASERTRKRHAYSLTCHALIKDAYYNAESTIEDLLAVSGVNEDNGDEYMDRWKDNNAKLDECSQILLSFPIHEVRAGAISDLHEFRRILRHLYKTSYRLSTTKDFVTELNFVALIDDFLSLAKSYARTKKRLGSERWKVVGSSKARMNRIEKTLAELKHQAQSAQDGGSETPSSSSQASTISAPQREKLAMLLLEIRRL